MGKDLRGFLEEVKGETVTVDGPTDPRLGISAYVEAYERLNQYPVLFFNDVEGRKVVTNVFASLGRISVALGCGSNEDPLSCFLRLFRERLQPQQAGIAKFEVEEDDLSSIPHIVHNELDGGPYIDSGITVLKDPESGAVNMGIYRHQIFDDKTLGFLADPVHDASTIIEKYSAMRKPAPVTINLSLHPAVYLGAVARLPQPGGEMDVAGSFLHEPLRITGEVPYITHSEIVIEGEIEEPWKLREEGPFGEWPKYYSGKQMVPAITVRKVMRKKDFIYLDIASAMKDHINLGVNLSNLAAVYEAVSSAVPSVTGVRFGYDFAPLLYIQVRKKGDAKSAAMAALAAEPMVRVVVVVDEDVPLGSDERVMWALLTRASRNSYEVIHGATGSFLNPACYSAKYGEKRTMDDKLVIDATKPLGGYPPVAGVPDMLVRSVFEKIKQGSG
ncbi:MAG: UbiD family decarboxylase [Nitrososphaerota archaeon]|nr:UbiD family decarboxylase [Nitrososphaerota archaeon]